MRPRARECPCIAAGSGLLTHYSALSHTQLHTDKHTHTHHMQPHSHPNNTVTHTYIRTHIYTGTCVPYTHTCTDTHTHTHTHTHYPPHDARPNKRTCIHTHTHPQAFAYTDGVAAKHSAAWPHMHGQPSCLQRSTCSISPNEEAHFSTPPFLDRNKSLQENDSTLPFLTPGAPVILPLAGNPQQKNITERVKALEHTAQLCRFFPFLHKKKT